MHCFVIFHSLLIFFLIFVWKKNNFVCPKTHCQWKGYCFVNHVWLFRMCLVFSLLFLLLSVCVSVQYGIFFYSEQFQCETRAYKVCSVWVIYVLKSTLNHIVKPQTLTNNLFCYSNAYECRQYSKHFCCIHLIKTKYIYNNYCSLNVWFVALLLRTPITFSTGLSDGLTNDYSYLRLQAMTQIEHNQSEQWLITYYFHI